MGNESGNPSQFDLGDLFAQFFASTGLTVDLHISEAAAAAGCTREVEYVRAVACGECNGSGKLRPDVASTPCAKCDGKGSRTHTQGFFQIRTTCEPCHGTGTIVQDPCKRCKGAGTEQHEATAIVPVPAGVKHEQRIRIAGAGSGRETPGDLYVRVLVGDQLDSADAAFGPHPDTFPKATIVGAKAPREGALPIAALLIAVIVILVLLAR